MDYSTFKRGAVVQIVSGGPNMTVLIEPATLDADSAVTCAWFDSSAQVRTDQFPLFALVVIQAALE